MSKEAKEAFEKWFNPFDHGDTSKLESIEVGFKAGYQAGRDSMEFKGACPTCEPVGELNVKLQAELSQLKDKLELSQKENKRLEMVYKAAARFEAQLLEAEKVIEFVEKDLCIKEGYCLYREECFCAIEIAREYQRKYVPATIEK